MYNIISYTIITVSYTHLDVYKRQSVRSTIIQFFTNYKLLSRILKHKIFIQIQYKTRAELTDQLTNAQSKQTYIVVVC